MYTTRVPKTQMHRRGAYPLCLPAGHPTALQMHCQFAFCAEVADCAMCDSQGYRSILFSISLLRKARCIKAASVSKYRAVLSKADGSRGSRLSTAAWLLWPQEQEEGCQATTVVRC